MTRLLSSNFHRILRSKCLWAGTLLMALWAAFDATCQRKAVHIENASLDNTLMTVLMFMLVFVPILTGLFISADYNDGTIRNKLTVGRTRVQVYLANLITLYLAGLFSMLVYEAVSLIFGAGVRVEAPGRVALRLGVFLLTLLALTAMSVFAAMLVTGRWVLVVCALMGFGLLMGSQAINSMLQNSEMEIDYDSFAQVTTMDEDGSMFFHYVDEDGNPISLQDVPMVKNPNYVPEPWRSVLRKYNDIQPGGQAFELMFRGHQEFDMEAGAMTVTETPYWQLALYSLMLTAGFTLGGILLFSRKDLK